MNRLEKIIDEIEASDLYQLIYGDNNITQVLKKTDFYDEFVQLFEELSIIKDTFLYRKKLNLLILGDFFNQSGYENINHLFGNRFSSEFFIQLQKIQFFQINNAREDGSMKLFLHKEFYSKEQDFSKIKRLLAEYDIKNIKEIAENRYRIDDRTFLKIDTNDKIATDLFSGVFPGAIRKLIDMKMIEKVTLDLNLDDNSELTWNQILWISYIDNVYEKDDVSNIKRAINSCFYENYHIFVIGEQGETFIELISLLLEHALNNINIQEKWKIALWYYKITFDEYFELKNDPNYKALNTLFNDEVQSSNKIKPKEPFVFDQKYEDFLHYIQGRFSNKNYADKLIEFIQEKIMHVNNTFSLEIAATVEKVEDHAYDLFKKKINDMFYYLKDLFTSYPERYIKEYLEKLDEIIEFDETDAKKINRYTEDFMHDLQPELLYKIHRKLLNMIGEYIQEQIKELYENCNSDKETVDLSYFLDQIKQMAISKLETLKGV